MDVKVLLQALARPWLIEFNQAEYWAGYVSDMIATRRFDAAPNDGRMIYALGDRLNANCDVVKDGPVQMVSITGPVMKYDFCGTPGMQTLQQGIRAANADPSIRSIVLCIDSPGGTVDGTDNLAREVKNSAKPVVTFINGMMCSAVYWIGSSGDEIVCDDANDGYNAIIGSIGTMAMWQDKTQANEAAGIKTHMVYASKSVRKGAYSAQANSGDYARLLADLDNINGTFLNAVMENRGDKLKLDKEDVLEGDTYNANDAKKFGLIDKIGSLQYAVKRSLQLANTIN